MDQVYKLDDYELKSPKTNETIKRRAFLTMRLSNINLAILFVTFTGLMIALVIVSMFMSTLYQFSTAFIISILFIAAMVSLIIALIVFLKEIHYTTSFIKTKKKSEAKGVIKLDKM
jgi:uncharacterized protein YacL